jgi:Ca-activated chloride channel family protein
MIAMQSLHNLHFLRPLCLLALPPLLLLVWWLARRRAGQGDWSAVIDAELLAALRLDEDKAAKAGEWRPWPWLALAWTVAVLALAGPSWQQDRAPAFRAPAAWVIVLDLSPSMAAADVSPSRVARARYAVDDLLAAARDARVGMVAFSDEAYTVTPLTQDAATVRALLPSLSPEMMPSAGDHLAPALEQAGKLLAAAAAKDKRIVVLTDGFDDEATALASAAALKNHGVAISVVGVGSDGGAPMRDGNGRFERDDQGRPVMARRDTQALRQLAAAGGGNYADLAGLPGFVSSLQASEAVRGDAQAARGIEVDRWSDAGAYLLPLLLVLAATLARRRWL